MKKIIACFVAAIVALAYMSSHQERSDAYVKSRVVQIVKEGGSCSGEQVRAPSGEDYILTAAHCKVLSKDGSYTVISESGKVMERKEIAEDPASDLLLLEGMPHMKGLEIAKYDYRGQHIRTETHGHAFRTYKTEGHIIQDSKMEIPLSMVTNADEQAQCERMSKYKVLPFETFFGIINLCSLSVMETATTAFIAPGSSGGPAVDDAGKLIGVVSAGGEGYGFMVTLHDIHNFVDNY